MQGDAVVYLIVWKSEKVGNEVNPVFGTIRRAEAQCRLTR